jgi:hypothetical protein
MNEHEEYHLLAAYWDVVAEDSKGFACEQALERRQHYLRLLGMLAIKDED